MMDLRNVKILCGILKREAYTRTHKHTPIHIGQSVERTSHRILSHEKEESVVSTS